MGRYNVGIIGATGYTGSELVRLLLEHPDINLKVVTSESSSGQKYSDIYQHFDELTDVVLESMDNIKNYELDLVFLALPHGISMDFVKDYGLDKFRIIDLSGDFRLPTKEMYEQWYHKVHACPEYIEQAVFGMPELFRDEIRNAQLVANPGCYPTSAILALAPLLKQELIDPNDIVVDSKSGVTGAGAKAKPKTHFPEVFGNFAAYGLRSHRHTPEIQSTLGKFSGNEVSVIFTPHLLPIDRGILSTTYSRPLDEMSAELVREIYLNFYDREHFVRILDSPPSVKHVRGSNYCDIYVTYDERTNRILTVSTIDNLVKGAAGQAIQNMNIMFGLIERTGLKIPPLSP